MATAKKDASFTGPVRQIVLTREGQRVTLDLAAGTIHNPAMQPADGRLACTGAGDVLTIDLDSMILWQERTIEFDPHFDLHPVPVTRT